MKISIDHVSQFRQLFSDANRHDQFSYEGYEVLFDYLEDVFDGDYSMDVIGLCCSYTEYDSLEAYYAAYGDVLEISRSDKDDYDAEIVGTTNSGTVIAHNW